MKWLIIIIGLTLPSPLFSQNLRIISQFDQIKMSVPKYEAESAMSSLSDYIEAKRDKFNIDNYTWIDYETRDSSSAIMLCFYNNILYRKVLGFRYPKNDLVDCKTEWANICGIIKKDYHPVFIGKGVITNEAYGGEIGKNYSFYLNKVESKIFEVEYSTRLDFTYSELSRKTTAQIKGYMVSYAFIDISHTDLSFKKGGVETPGIE